MSKPTKSLYYWIKRISNQSMPVVGRTVVDIQKISQSDNSSVAALAEIILRDPALTARVLSIANSVYYSPSGSKFRSVSWAILALGFQQIRSICLSSLVLEQLVQGTPHERVVQEVSRSLYAAVQARELAVVMLDENPEEIFVTALLYRLGEMAFWCYGGEDADKLDEALRKSSTKPAQVEQKVLGFRLFELTLGLAAAWNLGELMQANFQSTGVNNPRAKGISLCHQLVMAVEQGWDTEGAQQAIQNLVKFSGIEQEVLMPILEKSAQKALRLAPESFVQIADLSKESEQLKGASNSSKEKLSPPAPAFDPLLQLQMLREISTVAAAAKDQESIIQVVVEGIWRGVSMDRAFYLKYSRWALLFNVQLVLGSTEMDLHDGDSFTVDEQGNNILSQILQGKYSGCVKVEELSKQELQQSAQFLRAVGEKSFFAAPLLVAQRPVGIFYADRSRTGRELDEESLQAFLHFVSVAQMSAEHIVPAGRKTL